MVGGLGIVFILLRDIGGGGSDNGNFPLLYTLNISLHRGVGGSKKAKIPLRNIKMVP